MLKKSDLFIQGLLAFLLAHLSYTFGVINKFGLQLNIFSMIPVIILLLGLVKYIILKTGKKKVYVLIYTFAVLFLLQQAVSSYYKFPSSSSLFFLAGVTLFSLSDFLLAYNRFVRKFSNSQFFILSTYYVAQLMITLSI